MIPIYQVRLQPTKYFPAAPILLRVNVVCFPIASSHRFYVLFYSLYFSNGLFRYAVESELNYKAGSLFLLWFGRFACGNPSQQSKTHEVGFYLSCHRVPFDSYRAQAVYHSLPSHITIL